LDALALIREYVGGLDKTHFIGDSLRRDAVVRQLLIVGKAARHLSAEFRTQHPAMPWADIIGMRNRLVHDYINVDWELVWETVHYDVPFLQAQLSLEPQC
jgi:uncharacterized protein with HEPN domain